MQTKKVLFIADSLDNAHRFQKVLSALDVEVVAGSSLQMSRLLVKHPDHDLVIYEMREQESLSSVETLLVQSNTPALLLIVREEAIDSLRMPVQIKCDFIVHGASQSECSFRVRNLLWPGSEGSATDLLVIDNLTINLATYQVKVGNEPIDLTYLEYALLAFLATHPGRTYTRDALLSRVWGFDYYGGSRTVDVHVRRIRAKLGPELAWRLETVRGVGYLWSS